MTTVTYTAGLFSNPNVNGDTIAFAGSSTSSPTLHFTDGQSHMLASISENGSAAKMAFGGISIYPPMNSTMMIANGVHLSHGSLSLGSVNGGSWNLDGTSLITNGSSFGVGGGRYGVDPINLNGSMSVNGASNATFDAPLQGGGTVSIADASMVTADKVSAGLRFNVSGKLVVQPMQFLGTIHENPTGIVDVASISGADHEVFNRSSGLLDIISKSGSVIEALHFSGNSTLYARVDGHGGMNISEAPHVGQLPVFFVGH